MLSDVRKENIMTHSQDELDQTIQERLKNVSDADLANWAYLVQQAKVQEEQKEA